MKAPPKNSQFLSLSWKAAASAGRQSSLDRPIPLSAGQLKSWR